MLLDRITRFFLTLCDPYVSPDETGDPETQVWPYIRAGIAPMKTILILSLISTVIAASLEVWLISYAGQLIDQLADTPAQDIWAVHGNSLLVAAMVVLLFRPGIQFLRHALNDIGIQCNVANLYRWRAHKHLAQQSVGWFQDDFAGRTSFRLVDLGNYAANLVFHALNAISFGVVYMVGVLSLMAGTDLRLALPILVWIVLYVSLMTWIIPRMVARQQSFQAAKSAMVGKVVDSFSNFDTMKLFASREMISSDFHNALENTRQALFDTRKLSVSLRTTLMLLEGMIMVAFIGYGIWLWSQGAATIGLVSAALALTFRITNIADWIMEASWSIFLNVGSMREALKTVSQPLTIAPTPDAPKLKISGGEIRLDKVSHQYGTGHGGLEDFSITVKSGEKVGIVGRSGAGKSTLVNLILRFFDAETGDIQIDQQSINTVDQDSLRAAIGMVSQQAALLNRSVRDNIGLGHETVTFDQIKQAAIKANAHEFILELKDKQGRTGYDAHVGERGVKLSGGQRQRIALARVILKDAPILILDEATSALDSQVEAEIQSALHDFMGEKTVIAIAHRLSTIAQMDRIIVLQDGKLIEDGTHSELLQSDTVYASFWNRQSGGFLVTEDT